MPQHRQALPETNQTGPVISPPLVPIPISSNEQRAHIADRDVTTIFVPRHMIARTFYTQSCIVSNENAQICLQFCTWSCIYSIALTQIVIETFGHAHVQFFSPHINQVCPIVLGTLLFPTLDASSQPVMLSRTMTDYCVVGSIHCLKTYLFAVASVDLDGFPRISDQPASIRRNVFVHTSLTKPCQKRDFHSLWYFLKYWKSLCLFAASTAG